MSPARRSEPAHSLLYDPSALPAVELPTPNRPLLARIEPLLDDELNEEQRQAIDRSFASRASLIWGPPGTGKTAALTALVATHLEAAVERGRPVTIAVGASNWNAIDDLLERVSEVVQRRRIAFGEYLPPMLVVRVRGDYSEPFSHDHVEDVSRRSARANELVGSLRDPETSLVVGSTWLQLSKLASHIGDTPEARWFDLVIIDEASQLKVAPAAAYFLLMRETGHVVLAGDPRQLGPIYAFAVHDTAGGLLDCIFTFMQESHRLPTTPLLKNYRTNLEIADWPRQRFYDRRYAPVVPDRRLEIVLPTGKPPGWPEAICWDDLWLQLLDPALPVVALTYPGQSFTLSNPIEAHVVTALACLYRLCLDPGEVGNEEFWDQRLGIVTPHRAQVSTIRNLLEGQTNIFRAGRPAVDTVDRFQGQQRDVILASYSVADRDFIRAEEAFILDPRRFNVTLTRARTKFFIIMSEGLVQHLPADAEVARAAAHLQLFIDDYCSRVDRTINLPYLDGGRRRSIPARIRGHWT